jgi:hypothetical protein
MTQQEETGDGSPAPALADVRISASGVVEYFDGTGWLLYTSLPQQSGPEAVFRLTEDPDPATGHE